MKREKDFCKYVEYTRRNCYEKLGGVDRQA